MSTTRYRIYLDSIIDLAKTIVIKSTDVISAQNTYIQALYGASYVDETDPTTWKYYMNISGQYHFTDTAMTVISFDTLEEISFTKENLAIHKATRKAYLYGTRAYMELVARYPKQVSLILGILYPVDIDEAINAEDYTILGYPSGYVEANEYSLILKLQEYVSGFKLRWYNQQYGLTDDLYLTTFLGNMYLALVQAILNIRLAACRTNEAHSFHVREYLVSQGFTDTQLNYLTLEQSLWLYRNINYLSLNAGKSETFEWLIENIMTARNLPLSGYVMKHDLSAMPGSLKPTIVFNRVDLNKAYSSDSKTEITLSDFFDKEDTLARSNESNRDDYQDDAGEALRYSLSNTVQTKLIESKMVDESDSTPFTFESILLNNWLWLAYKGIYASYISVSNTRTGEKIPLSVKEAFILMWYAFCKSGGITPKYIPKLVAQHVQILPSVAASDLIKMVNPKLVDTTLAQTLIGLMPTTDTIISTEVFYSYCQDLYTAINVQRGYIALQQHMDARAMVEGMVNRIYSDMVLTVADDNTDYEGWLLEKNITLTDFTTDDYYLMYKSIVGDATGSALSTTYSVKNMQAAMVSIMEQLSSYGVQYHSVINTSKIISGDWTALRIGDVVATAEDIKRASNLNVSIMDVIGRGLNNIEYTVDSDTEDLVVECTASNTGEILNHVKLTMDSSPFSFEFSMRNMRLDYRIDSTEDIPGTAAFMAMTDAERWTLVDIYSNSPD